MGVTGFMAGAGVGGVSGMAAVFAGGMLNTLANGGSFGEAMTAGIKAGVSGMLIGAAVGGISGGIRAVKQGGDFWTGKNNLDNISIGSGNGIDLDYDFGEGLDRDWDVDVNLDSKLKSIDQEIYGGQKGCSYACKLSVDDYYNMPDQNSLNSSWLSKVRKNGIIRQGLGNFYTLHL